MPVKVGMKYIEIWKESMENKVCEYEAEPQYQGQIVFYGPSNFTRWSAARGNTPLRDALPGASGVPCCVNRGFGSTCPEHHVYYYNRMIRPLNPKVLVYSPGFGNGSAFGYTLEESWELAQRVMAYAREDFPNIPIYLCGALRKKAGTEEYYEKAAKWDAWLKKYAEETPGVTFVDVFGYEPLNRTDIFVEDGVHFNREGYDLYEEFFKEVLKDELAKY